MREDYSFPCDTETVKVIIKARGKGDDIVVRVEIMVDGENTSEWKENSLFPYEAFDDNRINYEKGRNLSILLFETVVKGR